MAAADADRGVRIGVSRGNAGSSARATVGCLRRLAPSQRFGLGLSVIHRLVLRPSPLPPRLLRSVVEHGGEGDARETLRRFLSRLCDAGPRLLRMCRREPGPVVIVDLGEVLGDLLVIENQARVTVR